MKTIALSTLALFALACAPEANDANDTEQMDAMDEQTEAALDEAFSRTEDDRNRFMARVLIDELRTEIKADGCTVVGTIGGNFDDDDGYFKAVGFGHMGQPILDMTGDFTWTDGPNQERILTATFTSITDGTSSEGRPESGDFMGQTDHETFRGIQTADGVAPLLHEGAWVEVAGTGQGYIIGLIANCD